MTTIQEAPTRIDERTTLVRLVDLMLTAGLPTPGSIDVDRYGAVVWMPRDDFAGVDAWAAALSLGPTFMNPNGPLTYDSPCREDCRLLPGVPITARAFVSGPQPVPSDDDAAAAVRIHAAAVAQDAEQILATIDEPEPDRPTADEVAAAVLTPDAPELPAEAKPRTWTIGDPQPTGVTLVDDPDGGRWRLGEVDWQCVNAPSSVASWAQLLKAHGPLTEVLVAAPAVTS